MDFGAMQNRVLPARQPGRSSSANSEIDGTQETTRMEQKNPAVSAGFFVVQPGFEPGQTVPKTVVLPLHHRTSRVQK